MRPISPLPWALRGPEARRRLLGAAGHLLGPLTPAPRQPRRILLLRPDHIGDVLLSMPAVALLRATFPDAELTYLVGPWSAEAARGGPPLTVQTLRFPGFARQPKANILAPYLALSRAAARLRAQAYDLAVVLRPDHWWGGLLVLAAGVPTRVGFDLPETRPLLSHVWPLDPHLHAAEQALQLARAVAELYGRPVPPPVHTSFRVCDQERAAAAGLLRDRGLGAGRRLVAIQPSAGAALKSWPVAWWAALADGLRTAGLDVLLVGGPDDAPLLASIQARQAESGPALAGQSLGVSAAVYALCALVIGLDGGGPHLAAAMGTPTVRLYGPASPARYGPWPPREDQRVLITRALACVPCGHLDNPPCGASRLPACLLALGVHDVVTAVTEFIHATR